MSYCMHSGVYLPMYDLHKKVTIWARVQVLFEPNRPLPIPLVMPLSVAHFTAAA